MRRLTKSVHILVDNNFYQNLERERKKLNLKLNKKLGFNKEITITAFTRMMADKYNFPKINIGGQFEKQKRRRI